MPFKKAVHILERSETQAEHSGSIFRTGEDLAMVIRFEDITGHDDRCGAGSNSASVKAAIHAAWAAEPGLDSSGLTVTVLGPITILEGYLSARDDRDAAVRVAEAVVGNGRVRDRMMYRYSAQ